MSHYIELLFDVCEKKYKYLYNLLTSLAAIDTYRYIIRYMQVL